MKDSRDTLMDARTHVGYHPAVEEESVSSAPAVPAADAPSAQEIKHELDLLRARVAQLELERSCVPVPPRRLGAPMPVALEEAKKALGGEAQVGEIAPPRLDQRFYDRSTVIVCPTRGQIDSRVIEAWNALIHPPNQRRIGPLFARGYEVGEAYNALISNVLEHPQLKTWKYVLTLEDDNIPPPDAHIRLLEAMERHPELDAISGLYHTKDPAQVPMAYGDPAHYKATGKTLHFPISRDLLDPRSPDPVEVLGIPMGCTLWRMDLFRKVPPSWFMTLSEKILVDKDGKPTLVPSDALTNEQSKDAKRNMTQDLCYCEVAVKYHGARFGVLASVRVGHLDTAQGVVY